MARAGGGGNGIRGPRRLLSRLVVPTGTKGYAGLLSRLETPTGTKGPCPPLPPLARVAVGPGTKATYCPGPKDCRDKWPETKAYSVVVMLAEAAGALIAIEGATVEGVDGGAET